VSEQGYGKLKMIRLGHPSRLLENIQNYSLDAIVNRSDQYLLAKNIKQEMETTLKAIRKSSTQRKLHAPLKLFVFAGGVDRYVKFEYRPMGFLAKNRKNLIKKKLFPKEKI
jgi:hypothetical protein